MTVTITSLKLKSLWQFFKLSYLSMYIVMEMKKEKGFIKFKNTGFGYMHFTISAWESEDDLKRMAYQGKAHVNAMKKMRDVAAEIGTYTYSANKFPDWKTAKELLKSRGKFIQIR
jgi:hypothetical protein